MNMFQMNLINLRNTQFEQIDIILGYKNMIDDEKMNKTTCLNLIDSEHGFRPSMKIFTDILNGLYYN